MYGGMGPGGAGANTAITYAGLEGDVDPPPNFKPLAATDPGSGYSDLGSVVAPPIIVPTALPTARSSRRKKKNKTTTKKSPSRTSGEHAHHSPGGSGKSLRASGRSHRSLRSSRKSSKAARPPDDTEAEFDALMEDL